MAQEFLRFLKQYNVIGLAIAVVIGGKLNLLISSLVNDLITPIVLQPALQAARVDDVRNLSYGGIHYGQVVGAVIDFLVVAILVFAFAKYVLREQDVAKK